MAYIKNTIKVLKLPCVVDLRGFSGLSKKAVDEEITEKDLLFWLKSTGRKIEYITKKIRKDRINRKLRNEVLNKYNYQCFFCGDRNNLAVDHIKPEALKGKAILENLQILCRSCNSKKGIKYG